MHLDLNNPDSIIAWWQEFPERHWDYLEVFATHPQFLAAVHQARQRIRSDPRLNTILAASTGSDSAWRQARDAARQQPAADAAAEEAADAEELYLKYRAH